MSLKTLKDLLSNLFTYILEGKMTHAKLRCHATNEQE